MVISILNCPLCISKIEKEIEKEIEIEIEVEIEHEGEGIAFGLV